MGIRDGTPVGCRISLGLDLGLRLELGLGVRVTIRVRARVSVRVSSGRKCCVHSDVCGLMCGY